MDTILFCLLSLLGISQYYCADLPCRTNCSDSLTSDECWREALTYRSSELIQQLISFSHLSVFVENFRRNHPNDLNDSMLFIDKALEDYVVNESAASHLSAEIFQPIKQSLIALCTALISEPIETVADLPRLSCSLSTCWSEKNNMKSIFIITVIATGAVIVMLITNSVQTHRKTKIAKKILPNSSKISVLVVNSSVPDSNIA